MKMRSLGGLLIVGLVFGLAGCGSDGDHAPNDAVVTGPSDESVSVPASASRELIYPNLEFRVRSGGEPVPGVEIEFLAGGFGADAEITDREGNLLDKDRPDYHRTETDESGTARVSLLMRLPTSGAAAVETIGSVKASVGSASATFKAKVTVDAAPTPTP